jgi:hypothetical protein
MMPSCLLNVMRADTDAYNGGVCQCINSHVLVKASKPIVLLLQYGTIYRNYIGVLYLYGTVA